jgi:hypothetical protein
LLSSDCLDSPQRLQHPPVDTAEKFPCALDPRVVFSHTLIAFTSNCLRFILGAPPVLDVSRKPTSLFKRMPRIAKSLWITGLGRLLTERARAYLHRPVVEPGHGDASGKIWRCILVIGASAAGCSFGALIIWATDVEASDLRRLHLSPQSFETLFMLVPPLLASQDSSAAVLRLALHPSADGLIVDVVKRRGPSASEPISVPLQPTSVLMSNRRHAARHPLTQFGGEERLVEPLHA